MSGTFWKVTDVIVRTPEEPPSRIAARESASHGSPERIPGAMFRILAVLYLRRHPDVSRGALAWELSRRLASGGIHYHLRTLRRQLSGAVSTVPPEAETAMRQILRERDGLAREEALERALAASGIEVSHGDRASAYVMVERLLPLVQLWLHLNPGKSKRFLASRLANDLGHEARRSTIDSLQSVLAGRKGRVQRAVHCLLLGYLRCVRGVFLEAMEEVLREGIRDLPNVGRRLRTATSSEQVEADLKWAPAQPTAAMAREWLAAYPGVSQRELARRLCKTLTRLGYSSSPNTLQPILGGRRKKTRGFVHRALLEQLNGRTTRPPSRGKEKTRGLGTRPGNVVTPNGKPSLTWREFLRQAREYLPSARSPHLAPLLAARAERLYGIPRAKAEARIRELTWSRRREDGTTPLGGLDGPSVEWIVGDGDGRRRWNDDIMSVGQGLWELSGDRLRGDPAGVIEN